MVSHRTSTLSENPQESAHLSRLSRRRHGSTQQAKSSEYRPVVFAAAAGVPVPGLRRIGVPLWEAHFSASHVHNGRHIAWYGCSLSHHLACWELFELEASDVLVSMAIDLSCAPANINHSFRVKAHQGIYDAQFARPGTTNLLNDGPTDSMIFSTGRRAVAYLQTIFSLFPRHDFIQFAYEFGWSLFDLEYSREDHLLLDFKLSNTSNPAYVWALIDRHHIKNLRKERFDLVCPPSFSALSCYSRK